jgi:hypothetical protein
VPGALENAANSLRTADAVAGGGRAGRARGSGGSDQVALQRNQVGWGRDQMYPAAISGGEVTSVIATMRSGSCEKRFPKPHDHHTI